MMTGSDSFVNACASGDEAAVLKMFETIGANNATAQSGLRAAAAAGQTRVVSWLFGKQVDANVADGNGNTALMLAVRSGHAETVKLLVQHGGLYHGTVNCNTVNKRDKGMTALHMACELGNLEVIKAMLPPNSHPGYLALDIKDKCDTDPKKARTPFEILCRRDDLKAMNELLKHMESFTIDDQARACASAKGTELIRSKEKCFLGLRKALRLEWNRIEVDNNQIGSGSFGAVSSGWCPNRNGDRVRVAVKTPVRALTDIEKQRKEFWREISIWALLDEHPNVLSLTAYAISPSGDIRIASPLADTDMFKWLWPNRRDTFYMWKCYNMLRDIANGLDYLHRNHVIHGDLKPGNILVFDQFSRKPVAKIADFGLSRIRENVTISSFSSSGNDGSIQMTPCFRAPEIATTAAPAPIGKRKPSDVWAFGMLCYSVSMFGYEPFHEYPQTERKLRAIKTEALPLCPQGTPDELVSLYRLCCNRDPDARPIFEDVVPELDRMIAGMRAPPV